MKYDPLHDPDPQEWLRLDEQERISLAEAYHRHKKITLPNVKAHSIIHAVVENQLAMGEPPAARLVLLRLMAESLDRHEAVHAIGSLVAESMHRAMTGKVSAGPDLNADYQTKLERLTAASWREKYALSVRLS